MKSIKNISIPNIQDVKPAPHWRGANNSFHPISETTGSILKFKQCLKAMPKLSSESEFC